MQIWQTVSSRRPFHSYENLPWSHYVCVYVCVCKQLCVCVLQGQVWFVTILLIYCFHEYSMNYVSVRHMPTTTATMLMLLQQQLQQQQQQFWWYCNSVNKKVL